MQAFIVETETVFGVRGFRVRAFRNNDAGTTVVPMEPFWNPISCQPDAHSVHFFNMSGGSKGNK